MTVLMCSLFADLHLTGLFTCFLVWIIVLGRFPLAGHKVRGVAAPDISIDICPIPSVMRCYFQRSPPFTMVSIVVPCHVPMLWWIPTSKRNLHH